jgi:hypothetical protein
VTSVDVELGLTAVAAMSSPTTLTFGVLALVLSERPGRTGLWFFLGAFSVTLIIGVVAAFVLGDAAASSNHSSTPPTWVGVFDVVAGHLGGSCAPHFWSNRSSPSWVASTSVAV